MDWPEIFTSGLWVVRMCSAKALLNDGLEFGVNAIMHSEQSFTPSRSIRCGPILLFGIASSVSQHKTPCPFGGWGKKPRAEPHRTVKIFLSN